MRMRKVCIICDNRPAVKGSGYCHNCKSKIAAERNHRNRSRPFKFATYQGHVIAFFRVGGGSLKYTLLERNPDSLPKADTIDLNTYIDGYTREQVKKIKSAILQVANA